MWALQAISQYLHMTSFFIDGVVFGAGEASFEDVTDAIGLAAGESTIAVGCAGEHLAAQVPSRSPRILGKPKNLQPLTPCAMRGCLLQQVPHFKRVSTILGLPAEVEIHA